jgi:hypothetical protein
MLGIAAIGVLGVKKERQLPKNIPERAGKVKFDFPGENRYLFLPAVCNSQAGQVYP